MRLSVNETERTVTELSQNEWALQGGEQLVGDPYSRAGQHMLYVASVVELNSNNTVCMIQSADHCDGGINREKAAANAQLLVSAPLMLRELYAAAAQIKTLGGDAKTQRAAIAKATGEQA